MNIFRLLLGMAGVIAGGFVLNAVAEGWSETAQYLAGLSWGGIGTLAAITWAEKE